MGTALPAYFGLDSVKFIQVFASILLGAVGNFAQPQLELVAHSAIIFRLDRAAQAKLFRFINYNDLHDLLAAVASMGNLADALAILQQLCAGNLYDSIIAISRSRTTGFLWSGWTRNKADRERTSSLSSSEAARNAGSRIIISSVCQAL